MNTANDYTLKLINDRAAKLQEQFPDNPEAANWNAACTQLIDEMLKEGLPATAKEISSHIKKAE